MNTVRESVEYLIIGAGIHGLSTAWHLAKELEARGRGSGQDILVLDKSGVGSGASGIACGCVRNFYMTEPLHAILRHSVDVWMVDPVAFGFQQVGYISCGEANQIPDYERVNRSQNSVDYNSDLYVGQDARRFLKGLWPDFNTDSVDVVNYEKVSGYAGTQQVMNGLAQKCADHGVRFQIGAEVIGYNVQAGQVKSVVTNQGTINCDVVIWGLGAWTPGPFGVCSRERSTTISPM
jgi:glycine/D-amino acid oxidase-like deaminating enzyme